MGLNRLPEKSVPFHSKSSQRNMFWRENQLFWRTASVLKLWRNFQQWPLLRSSWIFFPEKKRMQGELWEILGPMMAYLKRIPTRKFWIGSRQTKPWELLSNFQALGLMLGKYLWEKLLRKFTWLMTCFQLLIKHSKEQIIWRNRSERKFWE